MSDDEVLPGSAAFYAAMARDEHSAPDGATWAYVRADSIAPGDIVAGLGRVEDVHLLTSRKTVPVNGGVQVRKTAVSVGFVNRFGGQQEFAPHDPVNVFRVHRRDEGIADEQPVPVPAENPRDTPEPARQREEIGARNKRLIETYLENPWYAQADDLIGGWCVMPADEPPSGGLFQIANFISRETAEHIASLHNEWLVNEKKEISL